MNKGILAVLAAAAVIVVAPLALAQQADDAELERRLEAAQERLEAAAREVAELSAQAGAPHMSRMFEMHVPGPGRAMLGVNLGGTEPNGGGVKVNGVSPGGPAAEAGVQRGDVIVGIDGKSVGTGRDILAAMENVEPGRKVTLELRRDGKPVNVVVTARPMDHVFMAGPGQGDFEIDTMHALPPMHGMALAHGRHWLLEDWSDAELVSVTPALGRYFGADKGVLVARAPEDSALGLQDGDVIVAIGGREPQSGPHAMRILRSYQPGETVELRILRDRKAQMLKAAVPEREFELDQRAPLPVPPAPPRVPADRS